jgi:pantetheine-phosphate adenylyltransferase
MSERTRRIAIYPGSFDPITKGHEDLVLRALNFCDSVVVAVAHRRTQKKEGLFSIRDRMALIQQTFAEEPRVTTAEFDGLLVDFARRTNARLIIRGLRAVSDFEYEFQMALMNRQLWNELETIFLAPDARYTFLSASLVREIASLGGDVSSLVPAHVLKALVDRFPRKA